MRTVSMWFFGLVIWSVLMAAGAANLVSPIVLQSFQAIADALAPK